MVVRNSFDDSDQICNARPLFRDQEKQQPDDHRGQPEKADLSVCHGNNPLEHVTPDLRYHERKQSLHDKHQRECQDQGLAHLVLFRALARIPQILEKLGIGLEHEHIAFLGESGPVALKAAIKRIKLRVFAECLGVDGTGLLL
jgi:hypothetical protein